MSKQNRKPGFYWVKENNRWIVAEYRPLYYKDNGRNYWYLLGGNNPYIDCDLQEINEQPLLPPNALTFLKND